MSGNSSNSDSSLSTHISRKLPKLVDNGTTNNYGEWKIELEILLLGWALLEHISGTRSQPPNIPPLREPMTHKGINEETGIEQVIITRSNAKEHKRKKRAAKPWLKKNNAALSKIFQAVLGTKQIHLIKGIQYASAVWEVLCTHYQPQNSTLANSKRGNIQSYRCTPDMDVGKWLAKIRNRYNALFDLDPNTLSDHDFAITIVNNLPQQASEWRSFAKGLQQRISQYKHMCPPQIITSSKVIICEELYFTAQDNPDADMHVFNADKEARKQPRKSDTPTSSPSKRARNTQSSSSSKTYANPNCSHKGHNISGCFAQGGGSEGNYCDDLRGPWNLHLPFSQCTKENNVPPHTHPAFPRVIASRATQATNAAVQANLATQYDNKPSTSSVQNDSTFPNALHPSMNLAHMDGPFFAFNSECIDEPIVATLPIFSGDLPKSPACLYDSSTNRHVFNNSNDFESYQTIQPLTVQGFGNKFFATAVSRGNVRLRAQYRSNSSTLLLTNVLHILCVCSNLISGTELDRHGVISTLGNHSFTLSIHGTPFLNGFVEHSMIHLNAKPIRRSPPPLLLCIDLKPADMSSNANCSGFYTA
jgi:hypothetical protein